MGNGNLDNACMLPEPIKAKYGSKLSWGDLIILAGNTAIKLGGGLIIGFCGGRIDNANGDDSLSLGLNAAQELSGPCRTLGMDGQCLNVTGSALGPMTFELVYVNCSGMVVMWLSCWLCGGQLDGCWPRQLSDWRRLASFYCLACYSVSWRNVP